MANDAWFTRSAAKIWQQTLDIYTVSTKLILVQSSYTFSQSHEFVNDLGANEVSVGGYARAVNGTSFNLSQQTDEAATPDTVRMIFDQNVTFAALAAGQTIGAAILIFDTGVAGTSPLLFHYGLATPTATNGGDIVIGTDQLNGGL